MPLEIQMPEVADRLRRFFQVRGRMPTRLDEAIVPVAIVQNLNEPPWRVNSLDGLCSAQQAAVVGEVSGICLQHPAAQPGRTVVDMLYFPNGGGSGIIYSVRLRGIGAPAPALGLIAQDEVKNVEDLTRGDAGVLGEMGLIIGTTSDVAPTGTQVFQVAAPATNTLPLPVRITLAPGWQIVVWNTTANAAAEVGFRFTYYPNA